MTSIENRVFAKCEINEKKLLEYGFVREAGALRYAEEMTEAAGKTAAMKSPLRG